MNGLQPFAERFPTVLAPKTIDNDLGLNSRNEPDEWERLPCPGPPGYRYQLRPRSRSFACRARATTWPTHAPC